MAVDTIEESVPEVSLNSYVSREDVGLEGRLLQDRFEIDYNIVLGRGCWGVVNPAVDTLTGENVVVKRFDPIEVARMQMVYRQLDKKTVMINDARKRAACAHIVPAELHVDDVNTPYIVMPPYREFLSDLLSRRRRLPYDEAIKLVKGIAEGIRESHIKLKDIHLDIKPENIALDDDDGRPLLNDFGAATCASLSQQTGNPRDNAGFNHTRAPEMYQDGTKVRPRINSYAFFAMAYRLLSKEQKFPFEDELAHDPEYVKNLAAQDGNKQLREKIRKNIPRGLRKFLMECGSFEAYERPAMGDDLVKGLERVLGNMNAWEIIKEKSEKWAKILIPTALASFLFYTGATYEPKELTLPRTKLSGTINLDDMMTQVDSPIRFHFENISELPEPGVKSTFDYMFEDNIARYATENRSAAFLLTTYDSVIKGRDISHYRDWSKEESKELPNTFYYTKSQLETWQACTPEYSRSYAIQKSGSEFWHKVVSKSIEYAMTQSVRPDGLIDLEDTLAIALVGSDKVNKARRASGSFNFADYIIAKDNNGNDIISQKDKAFLKQWLVEIDFKLDPRKYNPFP